MVRTYISIGANEGSPLENIKKALEEIRSLKKTELLRVAPLYLTEPVGYEDQEWFHNTVAEIDTELKPIELLRELQRIENSLGRVRTIRWGPRPLDLDIIMYGNERVNEPDLQVPHPRFEERAFVLAPLKDLQPDLILPSGIQIERALEQLTDKKIICIKDKLW